MDIKYKIFAIIYIFLSLGFFALMFYPLDMLQVKNDAITIINPNNTVQPGKVIYYKINYYKPFNVPAKVTKCMILVNNKYYICENPIYGNLDVGYHSVIAEFTVPDADFIIGQAKLIINLDYVIFGGLRTIHDKLESNIFTIKR